MFVGLLALYGTPEVPKNKRNIFYNMYANTEMKGYFWLPFYGLKQTKQKKVESIRILLLNSSFKLILAFRA